MASTRLIKIQCKSPPCCVLATTGTVKGPRPWVNDAVTAATRTSYQLQAARYLTGRIDRLTDLVNDCLIGIDYLLSGIDYLLQDDLKPFCWNTKLKSHPTRRS